MNKNIKYLLENTDKFNLRNCREDLQYFNPIEYNNDDNDLIDNDTINDIIYDSLPKFTGSEKLKKILISFDWKEQNQSHYKETDIIGLLYAKGYKNPIQRFLSFIEKYAKSGWEQYLNPEQWMSEKYKYSMIYAFSETKFVITEHIGKEDQFYGNSVVIEEVDSKREGSTIILSSYKKTVGTPNHFMSIYAPMELYTYLRDFIKLYTDNHVNENLYDFDVTDYEDDKEDLIDRQSLKQLSKYMPKYNFEGADAILQMLNSLTWYETDGHEYDYFTYNTKKSQLTVYQPIIKSTNTKFELGIPHSYDWILDMILYFDILKGACWEKLNNKSERVLNNMPHTKIWIQHRDGPDSAYSPTCDIGIMFAEHLGKNKEGRTCFITQSHPNYKWEDALLISFQGHRWDNINYCNRLIYAPVELTDMLSSFIRYITGNEVEINESVIKFNPVNYSDESEDNIIDSTEIDNITYKNIFPGSMALIDILRKYDWSVMTNLDLQAEKAYSGIIAMDGNFSEMYNEIKECLLSISNPNLDLNNCCSIIFDDQFSGFHKKIVIEERRGEGYSSDIPCVISPCINGDMSIKFQSDVDYNFGRHIRCDIRLIRLLKEFVKNYE